MGGKLTSFAQSAENLGIECIGKFTGWVDRFERVR